jgi:glutamyl-tRNA(Gln) amidotransferase subunit D|tara:strand:- start:2674 stop:4005 length:1332 start_codon:yes stop_codon:yes gene_type:complete
LADIQGYRGLLFDLLKNAKVSIGDLIDVKTKHRSIQGSLMPRYEYADEKHIVIKMSNGYNIGLRAKEIISIKRITRSNAPSFNPPKPPKLDPKLPKVAIIGTGGTIASRVDYRTGGVHPQFSANELYSIIPEIGKYAQIHTKPLINIYSEHINADHWNIIAEKIAREIITGFDGIIVAHGTDTMGYTSAALSFALSRSPIPIILVGSQRSTDRPSSDAVLNLIGAVATVTKIPFSGVYVAMHGSTSDSTIAIHRGTRVRKNHTSRRDAFESIDASPVAFFKDGKVKILNEDLVLKDSSRQFKVSCKFEKAVGLIKFHPSFNHKLIDHLVDSGYRGIVLEGTGLGHLSNDCYQSIKSAVKKGLLVGMTSQCIWGRVNLTVYDSGRDLLKHGVIPLGDMLSETALVKMMWALGNTQSKKKAERLMLENIAGEYLERSPFERRQKI